MTQEIKKVKTKEELIKWQEEIYELEKGAFAGAMSEEEQERRVNNLREEKLFSSSFRRITHAQTKAVRGFSLGRRT